MAVSSDLTVLESFDGSPTFLNYSGGAGAGQNDDIVIEPTSSGGRRVDNATGKGFGAQLVSTNLSATGIHVKIWLYVTQWSTVTKVQLRISSGADDDHDLPASQFPGLFGWVPVWIDISRTPEVNGNANLSAINEIGALIDIGNVGGNASNLILDQIGYSTEGLTWSGSGGSFSEFTDYEDTNNEGNIVLNNGIFFAYSRLNLSDSVATTFTDSGFTVTFPDQTLVASDFMGVNCDLSNASTSITLSDGTIQSSSPTSATKRPDFIVTGTSGDLTLNSASLVGMRTISLTSACTINSGILDALDLTQGAAEIDGTNIRTRSASNVAFCNDPTFSASGIHDTTFVQSDSGHALEITSTGTYTLSNIFFNGYGGTAGSNLVSSSGDTGAAILNSSGGLVTINISGGDSPSIRNTAGSTTQVNNTVSLTISGMTIGDELTIVRNSDDTELFHVESTLTGSEIYSFDGGDAGTEVRVLVFNISTSEPFALDPFSLPASDATLPITTNDERNYRNP